MKVLTLLPARNEADSLPQVIAELRQAAPDGEILVVDDASEDLTSEVAAGLGVKSLRLPVPLGVGSALRAGLRYARAHGFDAVVRVDADGQHRADEIERLLAPIREGIADIAVGSRHMERPGYGVPVARRLAQRLLALSLSALVGRRITDPTSGFCAFGPKAIALLGTHHPTGYPEPELLLFCHRNGLSVIETPVHMRSRLGGRSSLTLPRALLALARAMLAMIVVPFRTAVDKRP